MDILSTFEITKHYAKHCALDKVSIHISEGEIFGLLGPNGAGKTSLIRIINQITAPDSGSVVFQGENLSSKHIAHIGYLPEERGLYKKMKVGEQAIYLARLKGLSQREARRRLDEWFQKFQISDWWNKRVEELSKGMQQKVQFITTVLHEPKLLIFDEPFSGFDPINVNLLKSEILELKRKGATIIFSTHNMSSVEELCDSIALINKSKTMLSGRLYDIKQQKRQNRYEITLPQETDIIPLLPEGVEIMDCIEKEGKKTFRLQLPPEMNPNEVLMPILTQTTLIGFQEILPSMNDIFIETVNHHAQD